MPGSGSIWFGKACGCTIDRAVGAVLTGTVDVMFFFDQETETDSKLDIGCPGMHLRVDSHGHQGLAGHDVLPHISSS
jgi:hypothetical protein